MNKMLKITQKMLSIRNPKWFFQALNSFSENPVSMQIEIEHQTKILPTGQALLEILVAEAKTSRIDLKINKGMKGRDFKKLTYPYHGPNFSVTWFESGFRSLFLETFLELNEAKIKEDKVFDFQLLFSELVQNANDHAGSERYMVYLSTNGIGVFDLGVTIPAKLAQKYTLTHDVAAIEFALKNGTTTRRLRPGGLGLHYTLDLLREREGSLYIASRNGQIRRYLKNKKIDRKKLEPRMPGTLIYCRLGRERE